MCSLGRVHDATDVRLSFGSRHSRCAACRRCAAGVKGPRLTSSSYAWHPALGSAWRGRGRMRARRALGLALAALVLVASAQGAWAATATEQVRSAIDRVLATVDNPALKGDKKIVERRAEVRKIADEIFDFREIARRSLGRHWLPLSEAQRTEFVGLFEDLLERSYISKIELYGGEKIVYSGERMNGDLATVNTKIMT